MGEDDIVELLWKSGQIVRSSQTQRPTSDPPILRGSGSGEGNAPFPLQNIFIHEDEMASWPQHQSFFSGFAYTPATQPQSFVSLASPPPPSAPYDPTAERLTGQFFAARRAENFMSLRGNVITGAGPWLPVVRESTQVGSSANPSYSATEYSRIPVTEGTVSRPAVTGGVSHAFVVPGLGRKEKTVAIETKAETEPFQIEPATETETADDSKRKEREETIEETKEEAGGGSTSRKRSRAAEMHNISERRRREKINEKMKALQELIPRCNKSDKASMLDDAIEYLKSLQMQIQMMSIGCSMMTAMYTPNMQRFMPRTAMGMMGMNRPPFIPLPGTPFPRQAHMAGLGPSYPAPCYPFPNNQASDPSRIHLPPSQQPNPVLNQPQFPGYINPYSQFVGFQQMQQPPPLQNQATSQLSFGQASSSKEPDDQENQPTG